VIYEDVVSVFEKLSDMLTSAERRELSAFGSFAATQEKGLRISAEPFILPVELNGIDPA
jgi:hypothetical protein